MNVLEELTKDNEIERITISKTDFIKALVESAKYSEDNNATAQDTFKYLIKAVGFDEFEYLINEL